MEGIQRPSVEKELPRTMSLHGVRQMSLQFLPKSELLSEFACISVSLLWLPLPLGTQLGNHGPGVPALPQLT